MAVETKPLFSPEIIRQHLAQFPLPDSVDAVADNGLLDFSAKLRETGNDA